MVYDFGEVYVDLEDEENDPSEVFRSTLTDAFFQNHHSPEKCCKYLCQLNNLAYERKEDYPKRISQVNTFLDFSYVILLITHLLPDEEIVDMQSLFNFWVDFLNENAEAIDRIDTCFNHPGIVTGDRFFEKIKNIIENGPEDDRGGEEDDTA